MLDWLTEEYPGMPSKEYPGRPLARLFAITEITSGSFGYLYSSSSSSKLLSSLIVFCLPFLAPGFETPNSPKMYDAEMERSVMI